LKNLQNETIQELRNENGFWEKLFKLPERCCFTQLLVLLQKENGTDKARSQIQTVE
jgi:hypothetical protein